MNDRKAEDPAAGRGYGSADRYTDLEAEVLSAAVQRLGPLDCLTATFDPRTFTTTVHGPTGAARVEAGDFSHLFSAAPEAEMIESLSGVQRQLTKAADRQIARAMREAILYAGAVERAARALYEDACAEFPDAEFDREPEYRRDECRRTARVALDAAVGYWEMGEDDERPGREGAARR